MTEFQVWRAIVDWAEDRGGTIYAACPPGSSVYDYPKFCLIDPETQKRDEPDILFTLDGILYFVECKPTLTGSMRRSRKGLSDENDMEKLRRIKAAYDNGNFHRQLFENYGVDPSSCRMKIAIGYGYSPCQPDVPFTDIVRFEVHDDLSIKLLGSGSTPQL